MPSVLKSRSVWIASKYLTVWVLTAAGSRVPDGRRQRAAGALKNRQSQQGAAPNSAAPWSLD
jgi:hypothetical protein